MVEEKKSYANIFHRNHPGIPTNDEESFIVCTIFSLNGSNFLSLASKYTIVRKLARQWWWKGVLNWKEIFFFIIQTPSSPYSSSTFIYKHVLGMPMEFENRTKKNEILPASGAFKNFFGFKYMSRKKRKAALWQGERRKITEREILLKTVMRGKLLSKRIHTKKQ